MIKFSIIIPSFNNIYFLEHCLQNILQQSYSNYEIILIDGGSTDGTLNLIKKYAQKYNQISYWQSCKDDGQADAINKGMKKCSGNWITWQNCDDYYATPHALKIFATSIKKYKKNKLFIANINLVNGNKEIIREIKYVTPNLLSLLYEGMTLTNQAAFWSKSIQEEIGFMINTRINFDYEWFMRILSNYPGKVFHINDTLGCYRIHDDQKTKVQTEEDHKIKMSFRKKYGFNKNFIFFKIFLLKLRRLILYIFQGNFFYVAKGFFYFFKKKVKISM